MNHALQSVVRVLPFLPALLFGAEAPVRADGLFARDNLMAWCIVPFDAKKRGPEERAAMLDQLGFKYFAYDYRAEHVPTFEAELAALKRHGVVLAAWWFPTTLNAEAKMTLELFQRHGVRPQLWVSGWRGLAGILNHTDEDAAARLRDNLDGLDWLVAQLDGRPAGPRPTPRSWSEPRPAARRSVAP